MVARANVSYDTREYKNEFDRLSNDTQKRESDLERIVTIRGGSYWPLEPISNDARETREGFRTNLIRYAEDTRLSRNKFCGYTADARALSNKFLVIRGGYATLLIEFMTMRGSARTISNPSIVIRGRCIGSLEPTSNDTRWMRKLLKNSLSRCAIDTKLYAPTYSRLAGLAGYVSRAYYMSLARFLGCAEKIGVSLKMRNGCDA